MSLADLQAAAEIALPALVLVALAGTALVVWLLTGTRARHLAGVARRQDRSIRALETQLSEAEAVIGRLTDPAAEILADVRGAHHRQEESRG